MWHCLGAYFSPTSRKFSRGAVVEMKKNTNDLRQEIAEAEDLSKFLRSNQENFVNNDIPTALSELMKEKGLTKSMVAKQAYISEVYLHQIFSGRRKPSRDRMLCILIGMGANLEEIQRILHQCGFSQLYAHNRRDAILLYGILHQLPLQEINDQLFQQEANTIF